MDCTKTQKYMQNTAKYIFDNEKLPQKSIINIIKNSNAQETLSSNGWPRSFSPTLDKCPLCDVFLSPLSKKKRRSGGDHCLLISTEHILEIDVFTKQCKLCFIVFKPDTLSMGLVNIGDLTLVSVDIFFTLQNTIRWELLLWSNMVEKHENICDININWFSPT